MKVFISYGDAGDQVMALRLQALGAVNGLTVYVPPAFTRQGIPAPLDPDTGRKLNEAEFVLGVVGAGLTAACRQELRASVDFKKNMLVMTYPASAPEPQRIFGQNLFVIDPANPGAAEVGIVQYLKTIDAQSARTTLVALGALAFGLLILAHADQH